MRKENNSQHSPFDVIDDDGTRLLSDGDIATSPPPRSRFLHLWPWLSHAPANEAVESIGIVKFNYTSIYRGRPSPKLDAAWDIISAIAHGKRFIAHPIRMTLEQLLRTGGKPSPAMVRYPDGYGGGYMATVEVNHQLRCLDMLRRASWGDHYYDVASMYESPEEFRTHLDHCIEMLRQFTMCAGDGTMVTFDWVEGMTTPYADFHVPHQCRNFDKVLNWVVEHRVSVPKYDVVRLDDNVDLPSPP
ncbi:hypothetical protein F4604DRAFT_1981568 [Suillus subluteus]|nr:hypothetical protein F4604DRAFT_1981568 [Suillus subluteus]